MSGYPNAEGVRVVLGFAAECRRLILERNRLVDEIQARTNRRNEIDEQYKAAAASLVQQLHTMDCASNGNFGWQERLCLLFQEIDAQTVPRCTC